MKTRISVAMAVYNGEKYLKEQIDSIICQMNPEDEIIVSVDPCNDRSKEIALKYADQDHRVRVYDGPGMGVIKNFENALKLTSGSYIFLSDQDDVWDKHKISEVLSAFNKEDVLAVVHDSFVTDEKLNIIERSFFKGTFHSGILKNIIKNRYVGCSMAFKRQLLHYALPFPDNLPMHDQWLGIVAKTYGDVIFIDKPLLFYRRHKNTVTGHKKSGVLKMVRWRFNILYSYLKARKNFKHK